MCSRAGGESAPAAGQPAKIQTIGATPLASHRTDFPNAEPSLLASDDTPRDVKQSVNMAHPSSAKAIPFLQT
jgi:hypothetical protein